jgi:hypothetical protein
MTCSYHIRKRQNFVFPHGGTPTRLHEGLTTAICSSAVITLEQTALYMELTWSKACRGSMGARVCMCVRLRVKVRVFV